MLPPASTMTMAIIISRLWFLCRVKGYSDHVDITMVIRASTIRASFFWVYGMAVKISYPYAVYFINPT